MAFHDLAFFLLFLYVPSCFKNITVYQIFIYVVTTTHLLLSIDYEIQACSYKQINHILDH